jgi:hypothetical protein
MFLPCFAREDAKMGVCDREPLPWKPLQSWSMVTFLDPRFKNKFSQVVVSGRKNQKKY